MHHNFHRFDFACRGVIHEAKCSAQTKCRLRVGRQLYDWKLDPERRIPMLLLIILVVLLFGGGGGYYGYSRWGGGGGIGIVGLILIIMLVVYALGGVPLNR